MALTNWFNLPVEIEIEWETLSTKQWNVIASLLVVGGCIALIVPAPQQWLKIIKTSIVAGGALAGCRLLYVYRTPSQIEQQLAQQTQELEGKSQALATEWQEKWAALQQQEENLFAAQMQLNRERLALMEQHHAKENELAALEMSFQQQKRAFQQEMQQLRDEFAQERLQQAAADNEVIKQAQVLIEQQVEELVATLEKQHADEINQLKAEHQFQLDNFLLTLANLQEQLYAVTKTKTPDTSTKVGWIAFKVQQVFWEFECNVSCEIAPYETGTHYIIWLTPRGTKATWETLKKLAPELPLRVSEIKSIPIISIDPSNQAIKLEIAKMNTNPDEPVWASGASIIDENARHIQELYYKNGIILDAMSPCGVNTLTEQLFLFKPKHLSDLNKIISPEFKVQLEALFSDSGSIEIRQIDGQIRIIFNPKGESLAVQAKKP